SVTARPSSESTCPPALSNSVLNHTTTASFWLACTPIQLGLPAACNRVASSTMPSHVLGGLSIKSARYQSNWVLVVIGAAYSLFCHVAVSNGPGSVLLLASASAWPDGSSESGKAQPASANSAVHTTSSAITSSVLSLPVSRRANCSRWSSAPFGKLTCWILKRPPSSSLQRLETAVNVAISLAGV